MAFQHSTRQLPQRATRAQSEDEVSAILSPQAHSGPGESQTWVLFTPGTDSGTASSYLDSLQDDQVAPSRWRVSDLGSLDHAVEHSEVLADSVTEEDAELDSLDSHLAEFRTAPNPYNQQQQVPHAETVLPGHDGLGSFRFEVQGMSAEAQNQLYSFERFNPHRVMRPAESFDLTQLEADPEEVQELERNRRIEAWRLEQSQLLLENIRKETRRRRQSEASIRKHQQDTGVVYEATERSVADEEAADINLSANDWHDQDGPKSSGTEGGTWSQIARKVICDLFGIDGKLLAILFGEALPNDGTTASIPQAPAAAARPTPALGDLDSESSHDSSWQLRMLDRIARELGVLVHQMSTHHPGAFSTYQRIQHLPLPYAGLPVIPETPVDASDGSHNRMNMSEPSMPQFTPTVSQPVVDLQSDSPIPSAASAVEMSPSDASHTFTQEEWERDLDIRLVFRYLRSRFTSSRPSSPPFSSSGTSHLATSSTQDSAAKAARVRQYHPLVSHAHGHHGHYHHRPARAGGSVGDRRTFKPAGPSPGSPVAAMRHAQGSCASQSTRRSARRSSIASSRASSRHYWDIGGSIGTGSAITSTGPMGSWGEV
ncbi:hypothetical protein VTK26DRAFT_4097 [Humicola hyalothermophila]